MKILVATGKGGLDDNVSPAFGRCQTYTIVEADKEITNASVEANPYASAMGGAGIQAAQYAAGLGVKAVMAGNFGPNASDILIQAGIEMVPAQGNVKKNIEDYLKGGLKTAAGSTAPIHSGLSQGVLPAAGYGRGRGMGRGGRMRGCMGMGYRAALAATEESQIQAKQMTMEEEIAFLEEEAASLTAGLNEVKRRLEELRKK